MKRVCIEKLNDGHYLIEGLCIKERVVKDNIEEVCEWLKDFFADESKDQPTETKQELDSEYAEDARSIFNKLAEVESAEWKNMKTS